MIFFTILLGLVTDTYASITGVTYMDNFDFERRYRNINECNPLYWHPLYLPDDCTEMFEKAIRSRIKSNVPIRIAKERKPEVIEISSPYGISSSYEAEFFQAPIRTELSYYGHPFGKMLKLLSRDVKDHPRAPTVGFLPNVGLVALYQQPISRKSEKIIKKLASVYAPSITYNAPPPYPPPFINTPFKRENSTEQSKILQLQGKSRKHPQVIKKKMKKGSVSAVFKNVFE